MNVYQAMRGGRVSGTEILGQPEILGDPAALVATEADQDVVRYTQNGYRASDRIHFGVTGTQLLAAGATQTFSQGVATPFKPTKMTIPSVVAPFLVITSCKIGPTELIDGQGVAADIFSEVSLNAGISWPTVETSQEIKITLQNIGPDPVMPRVSVHGIRLRK